MSTASSLLSSLFAKLREGEEEGRSYRKVGVDCRPNSNLDSLIRSIVMGLLEDNEEQVDFSIVSSFL